MTHYHWGPQEPQGGDCAMMDSGMKWKWNAVSCVISGHVSCHGPALWCPSPSLVQGATHDKLSETRFQEGSVLKIKCQEGLTGVPGQEVETVCHEGFWSDYFLSCSPTYCGKTLFENDVYVDVSYLTNSTTYNTEAKVTCKQQDLSFEEMFTCKEVTTKYADYVLSIHLLFLLGWLDWKQAQLSGRKEAKANWKIVR